MLGIILEVLYGGPTDQSVLCSVLLCSKGMCSIIIITSEIVHCICASFHFISVSACMHVCLYVTVNEKRDHSVQKLNF